MKTFTQMIIMATLLVSAASAGLYVENFKARATEQTASAATHTQLAGAPTCIRKVLIKGKLICA